MTSKFTIYCTNSLSPNFAPFLIDGVTWLRKITTAPLRGFENDANTVPEARRLTAEQKAAQLVKHSTSLSTIWQAIRAHFGFQSTGGHFLDFNNIHLETDERPEDLYQRFVSFIDGNLLKANNGGIRRHGENVTADEDISPTMENIIMLTWLRLIHPSLPALVKQRYGAELRSQTVASLKPEISQALDSLLDKINSANDAKVLRTAFQQCLKHPQSNSRCQTHTSLPRTSKTPTKSCPLCKQAGRQHQYYLSGRPYLPVKDKQYLSRSRQVIGTEPGDPLSDCEVEDSQDSHNYVRTNQDCHQPS